MSGITLAQDWPAVAQVADAGAQMDAMLSPRRFSAANPPPPERAVYRIGEAVIGTPGNVLAIAAKPKDGKTAFLGGMMASAMSSIGDTFNVRSENAEGLAMIHMDTEQSPQHHHKAVARALYRAGLREEPAWLHSYRLADVGYLQRRLALRHEMEVRAQQHGGIHSVYLDGVADFIADPNNPEEAFGWVDELHQLAIKYQTVIVSVLHENPGSETGKTRGHLGSQLERKAETNLRLSKDSDGVTVVFSERSRQAHIPRETGPRFAWSDDEKMHLSVETKAAIKGNARVLGHQAFAAEVFSDMPPKTPLKWRGVVDRIKDVGGVSESGAIKRLDSMIAARVLKHSAKGYYIP